MFDISLKRTLILLFLLVCIDQTRAWRRRRRCPSHGCQWRWGACNKACGGGLSYPVITVHRGPCGPGCHLPGPRACNVHCCRVDCIQNLWGIWSDCTASCGAGGVRIRRRVTIQQMSCGGNPCGHTEETKPCNRFCFNRGKVGSSACQCTTGWKGHCCEEDANECESTICTPHSTCFNSVGSYECACDHGFSKYKSECIDVDECRHSFHTCHEKAECINDHGHYICRCDPGYTGDGTNCTDVDECAIGMDLISPSSYANDSSSTAVDIRSPVCHKQATCTNTYGSFSCRCNDGYTGDGVACDDIDECAIMVSNSSQELPVICHANSTCINIPSTYQCQCKAGFTGNGTLCNDVNECESQPCSNGATCVNEVNMFSCACAAGYKGILCEKDVDECAVMNNVINDLYGISAHVKACHGNSTCYNTFGSFDCVCDGGFLGNGFECSDLDECTYEEEPSSGDDIAERPETTTQAMPSATSNNSTSARDSPAYVNVSANYRYRKCSVNANCTNFVGTYGCACLTGFLGDGYDCTDIDECEAMSSQISTINSTWNEFLQIYLGPEFSGSGDGESTSEDDYFKVRRCHINAECGNRQGSYMCECSEGYQGDGFSCAKPLIKPLLSVPAIGLISAIAVLLVVGGAFIYKIYRSRKSGSMTISVSENVYTARGRGYSAQCDEVAF